MGFLFPTYSEWYDIELFCFYLLTCSFFSYWPGPLYAVLLSPYLSPLARPPFTMAANKTNRFRWSPPIHCWITIIPDGFEPRRSPLSLEISYSHCNDRGGRFHPNSIRVMWYFLLLRKNFNSKDSYSQKCGSLETRLCLHICQFATKYSLQMLLLTTW